MSEPTIDTRNVLNRLATVQAGQEQMQRDVDRIRAGTAAVLTCFAYTAALAVMIVFYLRKVAPK